MIYHILLHLNSHSEAAKVFKYVIQTIQCENKDNIRMSQELYLLIIVGVFQSAVTMTLQSSPNPNKIKYRNIEVITKHWFRKKLPKKGWYLLNFSRCLNNNFSQRMLDICWHHNDTGLDHKS